MKLANTILALTMVASMTAAGCGTNNSSGGTSQNNSQAPATTPAQSQDATAAIKTGVTQLLSITAQLKTAINAGDETTVKTVGPKLEDTWSSFEDNVKAKFPDLYAQVESSLDPEVAASKVSPLDKATLGKLNDQLTQTLNTIQQKVQ